MKTMISVLLIVIFVTGSARAQTTKHLVFAHTIKKEGCARIGQEVLREEVEFTKEKWNEYKKTKLKQLESDHPSTNGYDGGIKFRFTDDFNKVMICYKGVVTKKAECPSSLLYSVVAPNFEKAEAAFLSYKKRNHHISYSEILRWPKEIKN